MGHLDQDPGTVTRIRLAPASAAVMKVIEDLDSLSKDGMGSTAFHIGHKSHSAGFVLELWIIKPLLGGHSCHQHIHTFRAHLREAKDQDIMSFANNGPISHRKNSWIAEHYSIP
jgi:hypothetical protein